MILLQLSAGTGPLECAKAVTLALKHVTIEARKLSISIDLVEAVEHEASGLYKSVLMQLKGKDNAQCEQFANTWQGTMLWICQSPFRPKHKRKNWFFGGRVFTPTIHKQNTDIRYETCRASGAGGQHVNTTDSAVRAVHVATGIAVRAENQRSQHANKSLATILLYQKLEEVTQAKKAAQNQVQWLQHKQLARGDAVKVFSGNKFLLES